MLKCHSITLLFCKCHFKPLIKNEGVGGDVLAENIALSDLLIQVLVVITIRKNNILSAEDLV